MKCAASWIWCLKRRIKINSISVANNLRTKLGRLKFLLKKFEWVCLMRLESRSLGIILEFWSGGKLPSVSTVFEERSELDRLSSKWRKGGEVFLLLGISSFLDLVGTKINLISNDNVWRNLNTTHKIYIRTWTIYIH